MSRGSRFRGREQLDPSAGGFRVPTMIVSPWTVGAGVSSGVVATNIQFDHTSTIQYLEELTGIPCTNLPSAMNNNWRRTHLDRKSTRLNSSHLGISYAVFCL